jgi:hypothetical protein
MIVNDQEEGRISSGHEREREKSTKRIRRQKNGNMERMR